MSWTDYEEKQYDIIPEGKHEAVFDDCQLDETKDPTTLSLTFKTKGNGNLWIRFRFNEKGQKFFAWQMNALDIWDTFKAAFNAAAQDQDQEAARTALDTLSILLKEPVNERTYVLDVKHNEYNGKTYANAIVDSKVVVSNDSFEPAPNFDSNEELPF